MLNGSLLFPAPLDPGELTKPLRIEKGQDAAPLPLEPFVKTQLRTNSSRIELGRNTNFESQAEFVLPQFVLKLPLLFSTKLNSKI